MWYMATVLYNRFLSFHHCVKFWGEAISMKKNLPSRIATMLMRRKWELSHPVLCIASISCNPVKKFYKDQVLDLAQDVTSGLSNQWCFLLGARNGVQSRIWPVQASPLSWRSCMNARDFWSLERLKDNTQYAISAGVLANKYISTCFSFFFKIRHSRWHMDVVVVPCWWQWFVLASSWEVQALWLTVLVCFCSVHCTDVFHTSAQGIQTQTAATTAPIWQSWSDGAVLAPFDAPVARQRSRSTLGNAICADDSQPSCLFWIFNV